MKRLSFRAVRAAACAAAAALCVAIPAQASPPRTLSKSDAELYQAAFSAVRAGEFKTAASKLKKLKDRSLVGYVEYEKLMHPSAHKASYEELSVWLAKYGDLPGAERVYSLADRRKPAKDKPVSAPSVLSLISVVAEKGLALVGAPNPAALNAFYSGDAETAYKLAANSSERWVAGLAAFRLSKYAEARLHFDEIAADESEDEWLRAGAAYWAARAVIADGLPEASLNYLTQAAQKPWTFYGMLAEAQLGLEPTIRFDGIPYMLLNPPKPDAIGSLLIKASAHRVLQPTPVEASDDEVERLVSKNARARRAAGLMQLGRMSEASQEVTLGLAESDGADEQRKWAALGHKLRVPPAPKTSALGGFDPADYPLPPLAPRDGFTIDPALVYAIVRQESRFNPEAVSPVGAVGLMQLMPETAAITAGDPKLKSQPKALRDPSLNLRLGQDYLTWLLQRGVGDDILSVVAAYNAGPGNLLKTQQQLGGSVDALMLIESLPMQETRAYVEKVMAGYWLYRRQLGAATDSLDALAGGASRISLNLEQAVQLPTPVLEQAASELAPLAAAAMAPATIGAAALKF